MVKTLGLLIFITIWAGIGIVCLFFPKLFQDFQMSAFNKSPLSKIEWLSKYFENQIRSEQFMANTRIAGVFAMLGFAFGLWMLIRNGIWQ
jgi:hypothetical protein